MAFLAGDAGFLAAYNNGDVYTALSIGVFGTPDRRPLAKRMFLAFSYGMTTERIASVVVGSNASEADHEACRLTVQSFFDTFPGLSQFRTRMEAQLEDQGFVASAFGNRRNRSNTGALTRKERRWAVNQPIQGTASLIFKEALIALAERFGPDSILLPMHDAVLMQFDLPDYESNAAVAAQIMAEVFERRCPTVVPRVVTTPFAD